MTKYAMLGLIGMMALSACAQKAQWQHRTIPPDLWSSDARACKQESNRRVNRDLDQTSSVRDRERNSYELQMARFEARKHLRRYEANCMKSKGYKLVEAK